MYDSASSGASCRPVTDLSRDELDILKAACLEDPDFLEAAEDDFLFPEDIPDDVIFHHYAYVTFVEDDFCTNVTPEPFA